MCCKSTNRLPGAVIGLVSVSMPKSPTMRQTHCVAWRKSSEVPVESPPFPLSMHLERCCAILVPECCRGIATGFHAGKAVVLVGGPGTPGLPLRIGRVSAHPETGGWGTHASRNWMCSPCGTAGPRTVSGGQGGEQSRAERVSRLNIAGSGRSLHGQGRRRWTWHGCCLCQDEASASAQSGIRPVRLMRRNGALTRYDIYANIALIQEQLGNIFCISSQCPFRREAAWCVLPKAWSSALPGFVWARGGSVASQPAEGWVAFPGGHHRGWVVGVCWMSCVRSQRGKGHVIAVCLDLSGALARRSTPSRPETLPTLQTKLSIRRVPGYASFAPFLVRGATRGMPGEVPRSFQSVFHETAHFTGGKNRRIYHHGFSTAAGKLPRAGISVEGVRA